MNMVSYVYILISQKDGKRYIGSTDNLERRYKQHVDGLVPSTKNRRPLELKCFQEFNTLTEARVKVPNFDNPPTYIQNIPIWHIQL